MIDTLTNILVTMWSVTAQMAPWLLFGFVVAGVLHVVIREEWVERHLGGRGFGPVFKGALFGVPLPLCSCGVIPVTAGMVRQGAGRGAASSFLISTPQTGVDSILATYALLGPVFAVVRPIVALVTGIVGGFTIDRATRHEQALTVTQTKGDACTDGCHTPSPTAGGLGTKTLTALRYGLLTLPGDIAWSLVIGIVATAVITALTPTGVLEPYLDGGIVAMVLMVLVGTPIYVCSTGSIPLALGFMHLGASPGAALAFLIAGPATNAATISVTWKMFGKRSAVIYLVLIVLSALGAGLAFDAIWPGGVTLPTTGHTHNHVMGLEWYNHFWAAALVAVVVAGLLARRGWFPQRPKEIVMTQDNPQDQSLELHVKGMNCSHCVSAVEKALSHLAGVSRVQVDLATGKASVRGEHVDRQAAIEAVKSVGYDAS